MSYYPPYRSSSNKIKVELDFATKIKIKIMQRKMMLKK